MWKLYDGLIDEVPRKIKVKSVHIGPVWTIVCGEDCCGIAVTINEQNVPLPPVDRFLNMDLWQLSRLCKSWDFLEAGVGTAALNAYHNHPTQAFAALSSHACLHTGNTFDDYADEVRGKKVAVIGHFTALERVLKTASELVVLERNPGDGDLPDPACEFTLPDMDFVFITGSAFTNKTLGRLLQLSCNARSIVIGPSTPLSPLLFDGGADEISGLVVEHMPSELHEQIGNHEIKLSTLGTRVRFIK